MAANPIFPLYYNDIDRSTRDWTDEEFGCYMRLLMHQWAQGHIPKETQRLARIAPSVTQNWPLLKPKFAETETGLQNLRLEEIREGRLSFLKKQADNGKRGGRPSEKTQNKPKTNPNTNPKKSLHIENENENENEFEFESEDEKKPAGENFIVPQMCEVWYATFDHYAKDRRNDFAGMGKILQFMLKQSGERLDNPNVSALVVDTLRSIAEHVRSEPFWINKPITSIANNIQEFYNTIKNPVKKNGKANSNIKQQVQHEFNNRYGGGE